MTTAIEKESAKLADEIVNEFKRLGISTNDDPCSGLMTRVPNVVTEMPIVDIYDDHASGFYDAREVLIYLKQMFPAHNLLNSESSGNIWQHLAPFEI